MSNVETISWKNWLTDDAPSSRRQALSGNIYRTIRAIGSNSAAVMGLVIVALLILVAMFAHVICGGVSPDAQDL